MKAQARRPSAEKGVGSSDPTRRFQPPARRTGYAAVLLAIALASPPHATQADAKTSALVEFTSNYVYRGYSKSDGDPVLQGNIDYEHSAGFFLGAWISQVNFGRERYRDRADVEANPYVGGTLELSENWRFGVTLAGYFYDGKIYGHAANYSESSALLYYRDWLTAHVGVAYAAYGRGRSTVDYGIDLRYPIRDSVEIFSGLGYEQANAALNYSRLYWRFGAGWFLDKHLALTLGYYDVRRLNELDSEAENTDANAPKMNNQIVFSIAIGL